MSGERHPKLQDSHLARDAYLYVRQATRCQGFENADCLQRQYHLQQQALALGWPAERVIIIDNDLGRSGASAAARRGFQELMRQVRLGRVGIVMALEASRLTRNATDWHHLVETCALSETLVLDQDGLYDPTNSADRVLLGCDETRPKTVEFSYEKKEALV